MNHRTKHTAACRTPGIMAGLCLPAVMFAMVAISLLGQGGCSTSDAASPTPPAGMVGLPLLSIQTRPDGALRLTTPPPGASDQNPAFSPDGSRLVFTRFENGYNAGPAGLFLLDLDSGQVARLTPVEDQDNVNLPGAAWIAPTGGEGRIVFASDRLEADDLWRIAPDGAGFSRITTHAGPPAYIEPSWSPDGQWIVFEASASGASPDGSVGKIWKVRADGTGLTPFTSAPGFDDRQPNWSPAGDRILFQRRALPGGDWDVYTIVPDGSDLHNVTNKPAVDDTDASWSPNGAHIVYSTDNGNLPTPNIFVIPATGGQPVRITSSDTHEDSAPSWSPDGTWIVYESHEGQSEDSPTALWRIAVPSLTYLPIVLTASPPSALWAANDFLYQLQGLDLAAIGHTAYDLVVMDYSSDGGAAGEFTAAQIAALKHSPGGEKIVLAYMSIGEAETYRFYWQDGWAPGNPAWLDAENPDWPGNYKVHYWDPAWQAIVFGYTERLLEAGFDGAYLDIVDAYEYYADQGRTTAAQEMADLVAAIRAYARARDPDFYVFPQNAAALAVEVAGEYTREPGYLDSVDGIGQEDIYYGYNGDDVMTPPAVTTELEGVLDLFENAGKLVLTVDYATTPAHVDDAYAKSQAKGYVPFVTVRALDQLTINPGHEPD